MSKAILTQGMQASGKSTWAKKYCTDNNNWVRISRDDLRHMRGKYWMPKHEKIIGVWEYAMIALAVEAGYSVVVDEMNLNPKTVAKLKAHFKALGITDITTKSFTDVPLEVCIQRDKDRPFSIGEDVLRACHKKYLDKTEKVVYNEDKSLPKAIIVDLDGTLALFEGNPYERDFSKDRVNPVVKYIVENYREGSVIVLSGRNGKYKDVSEKWLMAHLNRKPEVFEMREEADQRKDVVVKKELFDKFVKGKYYVEFVLDDRDQVVKLWRSMGLTTLQVADGDF